MSTWTHVCGAIRIDDIRQISGGTLAKALAHWQTLVPEGSEGELNVTGWENPSVNSLASYTITVHGDLRDYDTPQEIVDWLNGRCTVPAAIRNGCVQIEVEGRDPVIWQYKRHD